MCSVGDDIEELNLPNCSNETPSYSNKSQRKLDICRKCNEPSVLVLQKKDPFCKSCFLNYCSHKFKAAIGKSKLVKPGSQVLIAYSGGLCSVAMLHMVEEALNNASHKKLLFVPGILHIDESFIASSDDLKESELQEQISTNLKATNYPVWFSSLEMSLREDDTSFYWSETLRHKEATVLHLRKKLSQSLENVKSLSARQDYLKCLRLSLIKDIAQHAGYSHIFVGDCANHLAVELLSNIAMGRGSQISFNMSFSDHRSSIAVCRPMREFSREEIAWYNSVGNISRVTGLKLTAKNNCNSSIQHLTEHFVNGLQENFPATVYTIFRTGSKVSPTFKSTNTKCLFCESPRDNISPALCSALESLSLSERLSKGSEANGSEESMLKLDHLCHGCQVIFSEMNDYSYAPAKLKMETVTSRSSLREEIKDYLIE